MGTSLRSSQVSYMLSLCPIFALICCLPGGESRVLITVNSHGLAANHFVAAGNARGNAFEDETDSMTVSTEAEPAIFKH